MNIIVKHSGRVKLRLNVAPSDGQPDALDYGQSRDLALADGQSVVLSWPEDSPSGAVRSTTDER